MMMFSDDISNAITALERYIEVEERLLSARNASDKEWDSIYDYRNTLSNLKFLQTIYGK